MFVPNPSIKDITKILELILYDYRNFIFCLNLKTFDNILESLRAILALNNPNLSSNNIEHLIGVASPILVYFDRNEDGLFEVTDIAKVLYRNNTTFLDVLYSNKNSDVERVEKIAETQEIEVENQVQLEDIESPENTQEIIDEVEIMDVVETEEIVKTEEVVEEVETRELETSVEESEICISETVVKTIDEVQVLDEQVIQELVAAEQLEEEIVQDEAVEVTPSVKVNKYKLLKEKVKNKRQ